MVAYKFYSTLKFHYFHCKMSGQRTLNILKRKVEIIKNTGTIFFKNLTKAYKNRNLGINHSTTVLVESNSQIKEKNLLNWYLSHKKYLFSTWGWTSDPGWRYLLASPWAVAGLRPSSAQRPGSHWPPSHQKPAHARRVEKRLKKASEMQHSIHRQLKGQAHIGHLLLKNLRMHGE